VSRGTVTVKVKFDEDRQGPWRLKSAAAGYGKNQFIARFLLGALTSYINRFLDISTIE
jgi:hypothetical protein